MLILSPMELKKAKDSTDIICLKNPEDSKCFTSTSSKSLEDGRHVFCKHSRVFNVSHRTDKTLRHREKKLRSENEIVELYHLVCTSILHKTLSAWTQAMRHHKKPRHVTVLWGVVSGGLTYWIGRGWLAFTLSLLLRNTKKISLWFGVWSLGLWVSTGHRIPAYLITPCTASSTNSSWSS